MLQQLKADDYGTELKTVSKVCNDDVNVTLSIVHAAEWTLLHSDGFNLQLQHDQWLFFIAESLS